MPKAQKKDYNLVASIVFVILVILFGFYIMGHKTTINPLEGKKVIDKNITCSDAWAGAEQIAAHYNVSKSIPIGKIVESECKVACFDMNTTYYEYKCTSENKFLCYCN